VRPLFVLGSTVEQLARTAVSSVNLAPAAEAARLRRESLRRALDAAMPSHLRCATVRLCTGPVEVHVLSHQPEEDPAANGFSWEPDSAVDGVTATSSSASGTWEDPGPTASGTAANGQAQQAGFWAAPGVTPPTTAEPTPPPSAPDVLALRAAVDGVAAQDPSALPGAAALQRAQDLMRESERLRTLSIEAIGDVDARKLFTLADAPSTTAWVKEQQVPGVDDSEVVLSRRLRTVPRIRAELKAGRMSSTTGARLTTVLRKARPHLDRPDGLIDGLDGEAVLQGVCVRGVRNLLAEQGPPADDPELARLGSELEALHAGGGSQLDRLEAALIVFARHCDPVLLPSGLALLLDALLPLEHAKRAEQASDRRGVTLRRDPGGSGGSVHGQLDDELYDLFATTLTAAGATDPDNPTDTAAWRAGRSAVDDDTLAPEDWPAEQPRPRSKAQKRHDALKRGLRTLLDSGALGTRGKSAPNTVVTVPIDYLAGLPGALPGRTATGVHLTRDQLADLLCRGTFTRMVLDAKNRVVEVSHTQRTATALERLILHVQTGGVCQRRSCGNGPANGHQLVPHHPDPYSRSGRTSVEESVWLCDIDHDHHLHEQKLHITLKDGRVLGPDGWIRR
jgi:hypothetical protein